MLHINLRLLESSGALLLFWLLKWIGILALIVLGLIVFAALLVLLVPVRYRVNGSWHKKGKGRVRITWLLHILSITAAYDQKPMLSVRIFGYPLIKPGDNKDELHGEDDFAVQAMEVKESQSGLNKKEEAKEQKAHKEKQKKTGKKQTIPPLENTEKKAGFKTTGNHSHSAVRGIGTWKERAVALLTRLKDSFKSFCDKLKTIKEKKEEILRVLNNEENQKTVRLLFKQGKKAFCHILPVKGNGKLTFGFEDPYLTGQVLMAASVAYPFCHKRLELIPVFDQKVFQGEGAFKGRIRLGTLIVIGLRLLLHKNFRTLLKKWLR